MRFLSGLLLPLLVWLARPVAAQNSTYYNPTLPGWNSDPTCVQVSGTFYCVTSTFISFPGLPVYASKDLLNWKLISHAWNRESQIPGYSWATKGQQEGMYAATIRHHQGSFYVVCTYLGSGKDAGVLFKTTNPYDESSWSNPVIFSIPKIDPDIFWDDDGKLYVASQGIVLQEMNTSTGTLGPSTALWNGTGGVWPEGPRLYKKDGYYYLMIAEGGTGPNHSVTMARARNIRGPYEPSPYNPHLTNRGTQEYFQNVGHADLFQDTKGKWWGMALAVRSGRNGPSYPMGRETVLFPVTWNEGEWPILQPVRGKMSGWPLPAKSFHVPGTGPFDSEPDNYDFPAGSPIPRNLVYWRVPRDGAFSTTSKGLQVTLGKNDLTGSPGGSNPATKAISFIGRRQQDSTFNFGVDLSFAPNAPKQEAGVTAFLTQQAYIQLGVVLEDQQLFLRFNASNQTKTTPVPASWARKPIRLEIVMSTPTEYTFSAMSGGSVSTRIEMGKALATQLSGGSGQFTGTLIGVYATCNGAGSELDCPAGTPKAYFKRWSYTGVRQYFTATESIPSR